MIVEKSHRERAQVNSRLIGATLASLGAVWVSVFPVAGDTYRDSTYGGAVRDSRDVRDTRDARDVKNAVVAQLLVIYRQSPDTDAIRPQVEHALKLLPDKVTQALISKGIKVRIVPTLLDYDPTLNAAHGGPRGWAEGSTFDNVGGLFHIKTTSPLIAERVVSQKTGKSELNDRPFRTTLHESGHAFDYCSDYPSRGEEFRAAYEDDSSRLTETQRTRLPTFAQSGNGGPSEVFATSVGNESLKLAGLPEMRPDVASAFPRCARVVQRLIR